MPFSPTSLQIARLKTRGATTPRVPFHQSMKTPLTGISAGVIGITLLLFIILGITKPDLLPFFLCPAILVMPFLVVGLIGSAKHPKKKWAALIDEQGAFLQNDLRDSDSVKFFGDWADEMVKTEARKHKLEP